MFELLRHAFALMGLNTHTVTGLETLTVVLRHRAWWPLVTVARKHGVAFKFSFTQHTLWYKPFPCQKNMCRQRNRCCSRVWHFLGNLVGHRIPVGFPWDRNQFHYWSRNWDGSGRFEWMNEWMNKCYSVVWVKVYGNSNSNRVGGFSLTELTDSNQKTQHGKLDSRQVWVRLWSCLCLVHLSFLFF